MPWHPGQSGNSGGRPRGQVRSRKSFARRYVVAASIVLTTAGCDQSVDVSHVSELSAYQAGHSYVLLEEVFLLETDGVHGWPLAIAPDGGEAYVLDWGVDRAFADRAISDHWPVWADFRADHP